MLAMVGAATIRPAAEPATTQTITASPSRVMPRLDMESPLDMRLVTAKTELRQRDNRKRRLADSNCCKRLCRPLPNHSAKAPDVRHRSQETATLMLTPGSS